MPRIPIDTEWKYSREEPVMKYYPAPGWHTLRVISARVQLVALKEDKQTELLIINWKDLTPTELIPGVIPKFTTTNYMNGMAKNLLIKMGMIMSDGKFIGIPHPDSLQGTIFRAYTTITEKYNSEHGASISTRVVDVECPTTFSARCRYCGRRMSVLRKGPIQRLSPTRIEETDVVMECSECGICAYGYSQYELKKTIIEEWDEPNKEDDE